MPAVIDHQYREKLSSVVKRNMSRDMPIKNIFKMLSDWRNLDRLLTMEGNRDYAMEMVKKEDCGQADVAPVVIQEGVGSNVTHLRFNG